MLLVFCLGFNVQAQTDSRNRKPETVVTDGLAQLPAKTIKTYNRIMGEIAGTGATGIELLTNMLKPTNEADNSKAEYAINGVVNYVSAADQEALRKPIHDALVQALGKCTDEPNRAFLLTQLSKLTTAGDFDLYKGLLADSYLNHYAINGLAHMPGINEQATELVNSAATPDAGLAYLAYFRKLQNVEPTLIKWVASDNAAVRDAAANALTVCGSAAAIKPVKASGDTDSYLQLLNNLGSDKAVAKEAKELIKNKNNQALRCAGLRLLLKSEPANAEKNVLAALKDNNGQYRHTALVNAIATAEEGIVPAVAAKYKSLPVASQIDVIRWLGNIHAENQIDLITSAMKSSTPALAIAAIQAASKIGGDKALSAILAELSNKGEIADAASKALLSFKGNINQGVLDCLKSTDVNTQKEALALAAERHIHAAYPTVIELTKSTDPAISTAAYKALDGVANADNFNDLCNMLEASKGEATALLQQAAKSAIAPLAPDAQFAAINSRLAKAKNAALFYPLLAQAATPDAIAKLLEGYKGANRQAAFEALLQVNNPAVIEDLYNMAEAAPQGESKDVILKRYIAMVKKAKVTPAQAYYLYSRALDLKPGDAVKKQLLSALSQSPTLPAAMLAAGYISDPTSGFAAANTFSGIIKANEALQQGQATRAAIENALKVFQAEKAKGNADAGYSVDMINGILPSWKSEGGFKAAGTNGSTTETATTINLGDNLENFDIYFDWLAKGDATVTLRSMRLVNLSEKNGISLAGSDKSIPAHKGWNAIHIKMINDRIFLEANGEEIAVNQVVDKVPGTETEAPIKGAVNLASNTGDQIELRNFFINILPDTPIYTLSDEEKAQGFELLFDGRSMENFHGNTTGYIPQDGNIYVTAQYGGEGNLYTKKNYSDFIFRFEFFFDVPAVNNGVGIRTGKDVTGVDAAYEGMEIQILDHDDPLYQGHNYGYSGLRPYQDHGGVYGIHIPKHIDFGPIKQWHTEEIKAVGDQITVTVDGQVVTDVNIRDAVQGHNVAPDGAKRNPYTLDHQNHPGLFNKEGYISFCGHGAGVKFRNIRVLDLSKDQKPAKGKKARSRK